jgi:hypothetical protein
MPREKIEKGVKKSRKEGRIQNAFPMNPLQSYTT